MVVAAAYFLARGHAVLKVNLRGAGPSRLYCRGHYHAGLTPDLATVLDRLDPAADPQRPAADRLLARRQSPAQASARWGGTARRAAPRPYRRHWIWRAAAAR